MYRHGCKTKKSVEFRRLEQGTPREINMLHRRKIAIKITLVIGILFSQAYSSVAQEYDEIVTSGMSGPEFNIMGFGDIGRPKGQARSSLLT